MVYEIRPRVGWDKGKAVVWIRDHSDNPVPSRSSWATTMTDENAFDALDDAITVCVHPHRPTAAKYRVESPDDVSDFLGWLARAWEKRVRMG